MLTDVPGGDPLLAAGVVQGMGNLVVGAAVLALGAYGAQQGLFLAILAGMHALVTLVVSLAFADRLATLLISFEMPAAYSWPAAFGLLLVGTAVVIRLAIGGYVPRDAVKLRPNLDKIGGALVGAVAGMVVAGITLIVLSVAPVPEPLRIDGSKLTYDMGSRMLQTFARCVEPAETRRDVLLEGEPSSEAAPPPPAPPPVEEPASRRLSDDFGPSADDRDDEDAKAVPSSKRRRGKKVDAAPPPPPPPVPAWSEPFVDLNDNEQRDDDEPYLDTDGDGNFTVRLKLVDKNGNGRRDIGLLEMYRLRAWGPKVMSALDPGEAPVSAASAPVAGAAATP